MTLELALIGLLYGIVGVCFIVIGRWMKITQEKIYILDFDIKKILDDR